MHSLSSLKGKCLKYPYQFHNWYEKNRTNYGIGLKFTKILLAKKKKMYTMLKEKRKRDGYAVQEVRK